MNESVERCEKFIEESKLRFPLEPASPVVLMKVALEASDLNLKQPDKRSILKINNAKVKKASQEDIMHDHCYVDPPPPKKRRKLRRAKIKKKATKAEEEECSLQMEVIREHNNNNQSDEIKMDSVDVVNTLIDIILDEVARNKVAHMVEETNIETHLTIACGYAKAGDWQGVEKVMSESGSQGLGFDDGDYLELMFVMSEGGHAEHRQAAGPDPP